MDTGHQWWNQGHFLGGFQEDADSDTNTNTNTNTNSNENTNTLGISGSKDTYLDVMIQMPTIQDDILSWMSWTKNI